MNLNAIEIEKNLKKLINEKIEKKEFIYKFLLAYGLPKASIKRLKDGNINLSQKDNEISWKRKLFFKEIYNNDLHVEITKLENQIKHEERFIIVTNFKEFLAIDTKQHNRLDIHFKDLVKYYDFFLPWAGIEKAKNHFETQADVKAAEKMAKLFDEIIKDNSQEIKDFNHDLNVFLSRILFCLFAEDTNIFLKNQFTNAIISHTQPDGSDLDLYLEKLFKVLDTNYSDRVDLPEFLNQFPYVNGGLFKEKTKIPKFTKHSRQAIIDSGLLNWEYINPDIFGSMFQCVILKDKRKDLGMHYTSVPNIMKVINPLFLDELNEIFENIREDTKELNKFLNRIRQIKIFDPACGSGNFLIIAYKELRRLEMKVLEALSKSQMILTSTGIKLNNFYGIEIDDFAHEIARLSLWLSEHQMHLEVFRKFGKKQATLPLKEAGNIIYGNAIKLDWENVCPKKEGDEIYILGNPPYKGARKQKKEQKQDMDLTFLGLSNYRDLDYVSCWFYKGSKYIKDINAKLGFVSTSSINQGLQVGLLWNHIFDLDIEIEFAYFPFKWSNNAKKNAGVTVSIIGLRNIEKKTKTLYVGTIQKKVKKINAYLIDANNIIISRRSKPISEFKEMSFGNMPNDGGGLILLEEERNELIKKYPELKLYIKKLIGASEFIQGKARYCIWLEDKDLEKIKNYDYIKNRIKKTQAHRLNSKDKGTNKLAKRSHQFRDRKRPLNTQLIMPSVSSENRNYIPCGILEKEIIITNLALVIYDPENWMMSVLTSKIHLIWLKAVGGKLGDQWRYSKDIVYNNFPFPKITKAKKENLTECVFRILEEREKHSEKTLAELYDPDKMPEGLKEAHRLNDVAVEKCYRSKPFESDEERLGYLFKMYERMIKKEKK